MCKIHYCRLQKLQLGGSERACSWTDFSKHGIINSDFGQICVLTKFRSMEEGGLKTHDNDTVTNTCLKDSTTL